MDRKFIDRRKLLKSIGGSTIGLAAVSPTTVSAKDKAAEDIPTYEDVPDDIKKNQRQSTQIIRKDGVDGLKKYLNGNYEYTAEDRDTIQRESRNTQSISIQNVHSSDWDEPSGGSLVGSANRSLLTFYLHLAYSCEDDRYLSLVCGFSFEPAVEGCGENSGHQPSSEIDTIGVYWSSNSYSRVANSDNLGPYTCLNSNCGDYNSNGVAVAFNPYGAWQEEYEGEYDCSNNWGSSFSTVLYITDPDDPPETRSVNGTYHHNYRKPWGGCSPTGISIGSNGLSVSCSGWGGSWEKQTELFESEAGTACARLPDV